MQALIWGTFHQHRRHRGEINEACNKDPLLFISMEASSHNIPIALFMLGGKLSKFLHEAIHASKRMLVSDW